MITSDMSNTTFLTPIPIPNISKEALTIPTQYQYQFFEEALTIPNTNTNIHEGS